MNINHRSRHPQNVPNVTDEAIQRQFERFERINALAAAGDGRDHIISNSRPRPSYRPKKQLFRRETKKISDVELLGIDALMRPSNVQFSTAESSRISPQVGSPRPSLTRTIDQDLMDRLDDILDMVSLSKSEQ